MNKTLIARVLWRRRLLRRREHWTDAQLRSQQSRELTHRQCQRDMHLFKNLLITEVVDDRYQPVSPGQTGDRLLVTVPRSRPGPPGNDPWLSPSTRKRMHKAGFSCRYARSDHG
jgi:hypothetical protein